MDFTKDIPENHRSGFVNIIGRPNAGKSTLMNQLVGERLAIITSKAQTTRHRILGIVNGEDFQVVYSDTPGIINDPKYKLQERMMDAVRMAFRDADVFLLMVDLKYKGDDGIPWEKLEGGNHKKFLILNKVDLVSEEEVILRIEKYRKSVEVDEIFPISALEGKGIESLFDTIIKALPLGPPYYPKTEMTDRPERFFVSEIIREKIFLFYREEIPYSVDVVIESFKEEENLIRIEALIITNRKSQKPLLIGKGGSMLKKVGTAARLDMEKFLAKKVFLQILVKVKENWRNDDQMLRRLGYRDK